VHTWPTGQVSEVEHSKWHRPLWQVLPLPQGTSLEQNIGMAPQVAGVPLGWHLPQEEQTLSGPQSSSEVHLVTHAPASQNSSASQFESSVQGSDGA
jgi:hypothetical protein